MAITCVLLFNVDAPQNISSEIFCKLIVSITLANNKTWELESEGHVE